MNKIANMHVASSTAGSLSRRSLFKLGGLATAVAAGASLAGCAPQPKSASMADTGSGATRAADGTPSFLIAPEPITEFDETRDFEVVVVGAGVSGMAAAMSAAEAGAKIACVQREATPSSQGNMAAGVDLNQTSEAGKQALISYLIKLADHRSNRALLEAWADNSFEALSWFREAASAGGIEVNPDEPQADRVLHINGYDVYLHANTYFRIGHDEVVKAITPIAESAGVEFFFSCPAQQLVTDESGRVTGVVCEEDGKNVLFNASKGVILATGDYQCDLEMVAYYCPDIKEFPPCQMNRTGDGHKMGVWAGGEIEPTTHTKMIHDARVGRVDTPHLLVNAKGERFMCEGPMQGYLNNYVRERSGRPSTRRSTPRTASGSTRATPSRRPAPPWPPIRNRAPTSWTPQPCRKRWIATTSFVPRAPMTTSARTPRSCAPSTPRRSSWCPTSSVWDFRPSSAACSLTPTTKC